MEGRKFSSSRGIAIYVNDFLSRYEPDPLRYFLTAAGPETQDTDFTWSEFVRRNNDELVANWGNLVNRTLTSAFRHFGAVPEPGELRESDRSVLAAIQGGFPAVGELIEAVRLRAALAEVMRLATAVNQYLSDEAPWTTMTTDPARSGTVLYVALRCIDDLKTLFAPFLPFSSQTVHELLGYEGVLAGQPESREHADTDGATHSVLTRRLRELGRALGAGGARGRPEAARAAAALSQARSRANRRRGARAHAARGGRGGPGRGRSRVIDTHAHLDACGDPVEELLARARDAGVRRVVAIGSGIPSCRETLAVAEQEEGVAAALGIHPHQTGETGPGELCGAP